MKAFNLVDINKSDVKYVISSFPDGQQDVRITGLEVYETSEWGAYLRNFSVQIRARLDNFRDLELIVCATRALQNLKVKQIHLYIPHVLGARSDRKFQEGGTRYLSQVLAPIINMLGFESVTCIDVHSDVAENVINNLEIISNIELVRWAVADIYKPQPAPHTDDFVLVAPDAGASKKIGKIAAVLGNPDVIVCSKERDTEGHLSKTIVPNFDRTKDVIIVDDLCDGGGTFINIAKEIKIAKESLEYEMNQEILGFGRIYLIVTHGIFSRGTEVLKAYFDGVYCTNSYSNVEEDEFIKQMNVI